MSTIKSSDEHLTLNADGSSKDIKFQANGVEKASISSTGVMTATSFAGSGAALTGVGVAGISSSADATAITIDSAENVGFGVTPTSFYSGYTGVQVGGNGTFYGQTAAGASNNFWVGQNVRAGTDGSEKAITTGVSSQMMQSGGQIVFKTAPSANADANVSWTTAMTIDNNGYVTKGVHPNFFAYSNSGNVAYGSGAEIALQLENTSCPHFSTSTGRFTAPVAGFYHFETGIYSYSDAKEFSIKKNGSDVIIGGDTRGIAMAQDAGVVVVNVLSMNLAANDYVSIGFRAGASGNIYGQHTWFSGYLVG